MRKRSDIFPLMLFLSEELICSIANFLSAYKGISNVRFGHEADKRWMFSGRYECEADIFPPS